VTLKLSYAGGSEQGRVRKQNEDRWAADAAQGLFLISDGMGGHSAGALASRIVVETMPELIRARVTARTHSLDDSVVRTVCESVCDLCSTLLEQTKHEPGLEGMGATLVMLLIRGEQLLVVHLGDSRAYLLRQGRLRRLTNDHTLLQLLLDRQEIDATQAARHPARGRLTQYVGMTDTPLPEARLVKIRPDDRLLLCSDGLTGMIEDEEILEILRKQLSLRKTCDELILAANAVGGTDNITALVIDAAGSKKVT
jgi:protein phosphatase